MPCNRKPVRMSPDSITPSTVLVLDIGSTRLKAALYAADGTALSLHAGESPLQSPRPSPTQVLDAVIAAAAKVCGSVKPEAIAITGATRTDVLAAADGSAIGDVVKLDDARGAEFEPAVQKAYADPDGRSYGAFHPLARLLDSQVRQPVQYAAARWQLELKDWLNLQLTGIACTDTVAHARLMPRNGKLDNVLQTLGLKSGLCAPATGLATRVGPVNSGDARLAHWAGVPVVQCGFDSWCANYGMGCVQDGQFYNVTGTTEVFGSFSNVNQALPGVSSLPWAPGLYHLGGPCLTGLGTLAWFGRTFMNDGNPQTVMDCAARANVDRPICLPFLSGERMPFWRADLSAQFIGVRSQHGLPEMAGALADGLMVFQRYLMVLLCPQATAIYLSGGAASLAGWAELKASAFGIPARRCSAAEPALLGAAMSALTAIGRFSSLADAQQALAPAPVTVQPDLAETRRIEAVERRLLPHLRAIASV